MLGPVFGQFSCLINYIVHCTILHCSLIETCSSKLVCLTKTKAILHIAYLTTSEHTTISNTSKFPNNTSL